ncbi:MAG TPA: methyltransferase domain-containing protein [Rhizomicrobium sp.]|jgi:SAM-dependent methyltransferase|nr:methyltransferase domain-containing protein [Rhizomicrobium sp.]
MGTEIAPPGYGLGPQYDPIYLGWLSLIPKSVFVGCCLFVASVSLWNVYLAINTGAAALIEPSSKLVILILMAVVILNYVIALYIAFNFHFGAGFRLSFSTYLQMILFVAFISVPVLWLVFKYLIVSAGHADRPWGLVIGSIGFVLSVATGFADRIPEWGLQPLTGYKFVKAIVGSVKFHRQLFVESWKVGREGAKDVREELAEATSTADQIRKRRANLFGETELVRKFQDACTTPEIEAAAVSSSERWRSFVEQRVFKGEERIDVLDVGGAEGRLTSGLVRMLLDARGKVRPPISLKISMVDPGQWSLEYSARIEQTVKELLPPKNVVLKVKNEKFDFSHVAGSYDLIVLGHSMYAYLDSIRSRPNWRVEVQDTLARLYGTLKPNGLLLISIASADGVAPWLKRKLLTGIFGFAPLDANAVDIQTATDQFPIKESRDVDSFFVFPSTDDGTLSKKHIFDWLNYFVRIRLDELPPGFQRWVLDLFWRSSTLPKFLTLAEQDVLRNLSSEGSTDAFTRIIRHRSRIFLIQRS